MPPQTRKKEESWLEWLARKARETDVPVPPILAPLLGATVKGGSLRQAPAGALETTIADSRRRTNARRDNITVPVPYVGPVSVPYRPAIVDQIPAVAGLVKTLATGEMPAQDSLLGASMDRARAASERANAALGITYPMNTQETMLRVGGALAVPGPKIPRVPSSAPVLARALGQTGRVAAEVAIPLRQGGARTAAVAGAIGTAIPETIDAVIPGTLDNRETGEEYYGILDRTGLIAQPDTPSIDELMAEPVSADELDQQDQLMSQPLQEAELDAAEEQEQTNKWASAGLALTALVGGGTAIYYGRQLAARRLNDAAREAPSFVGKTVRRSRSKATDRAVGAMFRQDQPVRNAADDFLSPQQAKQYGYKSDLANNVSIGARVQHQFRTGRMIGVPPRANGTPRRTVPLAPLANAYAKELSLEEQRTVADALLAASALDDFRATGTLASLNRDKAGNPVNARDLEALVNSVKANPKLAKYMDGVQQSFADILEFRVARGLMTRATADEFKARRPNYVAMKRDLDTDAQLPEPNVYNANRDRGGGQSRATEELGGVQGGAVGNPFNVLFDNWATEIRRAEINDLRATFLQQMDQAGGGMSRQGGRLVYRLPDGVKANTNEGKHVVHINGKAVTYQVNDPMLAQALEYAPRATIQTLERIRQISQSLTTGPIGTLFNAFAIAKSTLYDTTLGALLKPKDVHLGMINEVLSNIHPKASIGRLDPTQYVSAFTGAARYAWDDLRGAMAQNLSDQLIRDHSWLRSMLGDNAVVLLRDRLEASFEASVKSIMDEHGITSATMHGTPDPSQVLTSMGDVAPAFDNAAAKQRYLEDGLSLMDRAQGVNAYLGLKNNRIRRAYTSLLEAFHNGFRYSATAANIKRNKNMEKLASQMRRLSVDAAQHGGNRGLNKTLGSFMYGNLTMQTLYETGLAIRRNPTTFLANLGALGMTAAAMHYLALATDPAAKEKHKNKTAQQKAASITTFGGAEIPIDPILRIPISNTFTILDHVTGAHDGNWDGNFLEAFNNLLEGDWMDDEAYTEDASAVLKESVRTNLPIAPENNPISAALQAYLGIDPAMTRISGETTPVMTQRMSGMDMDKTRVDGMGSAYAENIVSSLFGTAGDSVWRMADDAGRAFGDTGEVGAAVDAALSRYKDKMVNSTATLKPILFGGYEQVFSVTDTNWQLVRAREEGIERAVAVNTRDIRGAGDTGFTLGKDLNLPSDTQRAPQEMAGTPLDIIAASGQRLSNDLKYYNNILADLGKQTEAVRSFYTTPQEQRNGMINEINEQRKYYALLKLQLIRRVEQQVQDQIGDPDFRFDNFEPEQYQAVDGE